MQLQYRILQGFRVTCAQLLFSLSLSFWLKYFLHENLILHVHGLELSQKSLCSLTIGTVHLCIGVARQALMSDPFFPFEMRRLLF